MLPTARYVPNARTARGNVDVNPPMTGQSNPPPDPSGASTQNAQYSQSVTYPSSQQSGIAMGSSIRSREQRVAHRPPAC